MNPIEIKPPDVMTVADVAATLQISHPKVRQMVASGELPSLRIGRNIRIPRAELQRWISDHTAA